MNKKKTVINVSLYIGVLLTIILCFVFFLRWDSARTMSKVWIANQDIKKGTQMTLQNTEKMFKEIEVGESFKKELEKSGAVLIDKSNMPDENEIAKIDIPKGTTILENMFEEGNGKENTELNFAEPKRIYLDVPKGSAPVGGFYEDQDVSIYGKVNVLDGEVSKKVFTIITSKMRIKEIIKNEDGGVSQVGVVVELNEMSRILQSIDSADKFFFLDGVVKNLPAQLEEEIKNDIFNGTGYQDTRNFKLNVSEVDNGQTLKSYEDVTTVKQNEKYSDLTTFVLGDTTNRGIKFSWQGQFNKVAVKHKTLENKIGVANGIYSQVSSTNSTSKNIVYDEVNELREFNQSFTEEGYYELEFRGYRLDAQKGPEGQMITTKVPETHRYRFVIEKKRREVETTGGIKLLITDNGAKEKIGVDLGLRKDYYETIDELKGFSKKVNLNKKLFEESTIYDLKDGIGTINDKVIKQVQIQMGTARINAFYGYKNLDGFDKSVDSNIEDYFGEVGKTVSLPLSQDGSAIKVAGMGLGLDYGKITAFNHRTYNEMLDVIKTIDSDKTAYESTDSPLMKDLLKHFLTGNALQFDFTKETTKATLQDKKEKSLTITDENGTEYKYKIEVIFK